MLIETACIPPPHPHHEPFSHPPLSPVQPPYPSAYAQIEGRPFPFTLGEAVTGAEGAFGLQPEGLLPTGDTALTTMWRGEDGRPIVAVRNAAAARGPAPAPLEPRAALLGPPGCAELAGAGETAGEVAARRAARARAAQRHAHWISHFGLVRAYYYYF